MRVASWAWLVGALSACAAPGLHETPGAERSRAAAEEATPTDVDAVAPAAPARDRQARPEAPADADAAGEADTKANAEAPANEHAQPDAPPEAAPSDDPKAVLLAHLGRSDEAVQWTVLSTDPIEDSDDRVIAFQRVPEPPEDWDDEDDLPSVEVEVVAVTADGATHPLYSHTHPLYECESMEVYATPLTDAPQVVWLDLSCRSGEDFWSIDVDSSLYLRDTKGPWKRLWTGSQSVSGQWTACRDAEEIDVVVRDGALVIDHLRYREYTPEPDDHVKRSDCPPRKLRRKRLARIPLPTP